MATVERASRLSGVPVSVLRGPSRYRGICLVRWAAMVAMRGRGMSYPAIGRHLHRDHASVINGIRQAERYAAVNPNYAKMLEAVACDLP